MELPVDWVERKRDAGPLDDGEGGGSITTHIVGGGWEDSRGSAESCVARELSDERRLACELGSWSGGCAVRLRDKTSLSYNFVTSPMCS